MNQEENQELISRNAFFPFIGLLVLFSLAMLPFGFRSPEEKILKARAKAEILAYQVAQLYRESLPTKASANVSGGGRGPASIEEMPTAPAEGVMGQDPWGHPYHYRITPSSVGDGKLKVEMRSAGPDEASESSGSDVLLVLSL